MKIYKICEKLSQADYCIVFFLGMVKCSSLRLELVNLVSQLIALRVDLEKYYDHEETYHIEDTDEYSAIDDATEAIESVVDCVEDLYDTDIFFMRQVIREKLQNVLIKLESLANEIDYEFDDGGIPGLSYEENQFAIKNTKNI